MNKRTHLNGLTRLWSIFSALSCISMFLIYAKSYKEKVREFYSGYFFSFEKMTTKQINVKIRNV